MGITSESKSLAWRLVPLLVLCLSIASGCGETIPTGTVKGKVTLDGEPYSNASLVLLGVDSGQGGSADIQSDGTFAITSPLPVGTYMAYLAPKAGEGGVDEAAPVKIDTSVPDKYWSEMTDIKIEVAEGANEGVEIAMKSGG